MLVAVMHRLQPRSRKGRSQRRAATIAALVVVLFLCGMAWSRGFLEWDGERTVYTARCPRWQGDRCIGRQTPGERWRFRILRQSAQVSVEVLDMPQRKGVLGGCAIHGARSWSCEQLQSGTAPLAVPCAMERGMPLAATMDPQLRPIGKADWYLLFLL